MKSCFMETDRLGFSVWEEGDLPFATELWGDADVARYISAAGGFTEEQVKQRLTREIANHTAFGVQYWPVILLETGELAGCCGLRPYDEARRIFELGVHLKKKFWGMGLAQEACRAAITYAFDKTGASALFAGHNPNNEASAKMLKRLGFRYTHDEYYAPTGLNHPSYLLTKEEYEAAGKA